MRPCSGLASPPTSTPPWWVLTCELKQLQLPAMSAQEQGLWVARLRWGQQPGQQGWGGEAMVPLEHWHQRAALVHQIERELGTRRRWAQGLAKAPVGLAQVELQGLSGHIHIWLTLMWA